MADVGSVGARPAATAEQNAIAPNASTNRTGGEVSGATNPASTNSAMDAPVGPRGPLGQPTGLPMPALPGERDLLTDVLAGLDASQLIAAEEMRTRAGASAVETLLGLDARPTTIGDFAAPPLTSKLFQQMSPALRRATMWALLMKHRAYLQRLVTMLQAEYEGDSDRRHSNDEQEAPSSEELLPRDPVNPRALVELNSVAQMLNTIERLLIMQDYALSRIGTFSKG